MAEVMYFEFLHSNGVSRDIAQRIWEWFDQNPNTKVRRHPDNEFVPGEEFKVYTDHNDDTAIGTIRPFDADDDDIPFAAPPLTGFELVKSVDHWQTMDDPTDEVEAEIALVKNIYLASEPRPEFTYGLDPGHVELVYSDWELPISSENLEDGSIDDVSWLMLFPPAMVESYGRSFLLDAPAWRTEELNDGGILIVATADPSDPANLDLDPLRDHFGIRSPT